ncbi:hypothetical protein PO909_002386 [Leuciscus waleckii]
MADSAEERPPHTGERDDLASPTRLVGPPCMAPQRVSGIPPGYNYICKPRPSRRGGGLAVIFNQNFRITELTLPSVSSFEYLAFKALSSMTVILIYRPPKPNPSFLSDFTELLTLASSLSPRLLLLGDLNIHIDSPTCKLSSEFTILVDNFTLTQHVTFPTHDKGHILDLHRNRSPQNPQRPSHIRTGSLHILILLDLSAAFDTTSAIKTWMQHNFLKLNSDKTEFLLICSKSTLGKINNPTLIIDGTIVFPSPQARNLGVIFDSSLSLEPHIRHVIKTSFFHLRNIAKIRPSLTPPSTGKNHSRLHLLPTGLLQLTTPWHQLYLHQTTPTGPTGPAARLITRSKSWLHITQVLKQLYWLPISHRITYKILVLTYKALHHLAPSYLTDLLSPYQPSRSLRSTSAGLLCIHKSNLRSFGDRAFSRAAPRLWNSLPQEVRTSESFTIFQSLLKTHLFTSAYP